ncbi:MAG: glycosyltransferase family 1 protein [Rhodospirillaceae bacterium]|nr:glycosyltransferase family 1 protein [Rhodospirillaceae bacterium]HAA91233.1 glycosyltransferase family 1 protein [Rhodospirillaceae bacterium]
MPLRDKKILFVVSEDWYFCSHRLELGAALVAAGAKVAVATRLDKDRDTIIRAGIRVIPFNLARSGRNPFRDIASIFRLISIYIRERPDLVHHVALKPTLYGAFAAWLTRVPAVVNALGGMGFVFISESLFARAVRKTTALAFKFLMNRKNSRTILQNPDDIALYRDRIGVVESQLALIKGSGVDLATFKVAPEKDGKPTAVCVSRMLWDKGIGELVYAARILKERGAPVKVRLVGPTDANPASIPPETLESWHKQGIVEVAGPKTDIAAEYRNAHIAVLPSYREGLPKSLLEAAASGRAMVASDVPGCREVCRNGKTGLLVPVNSVEPLSDALERLATDGSLRQKLGAEARRVAEREFGVEAVISATLDLYTEILK